jgi:hypothetical protein
VSRLISRPGSVGSPKVVSSPRKMRLPTWD